MFPIINMHYKQRVFGKSRKFSLTGFNDYCEPNNAPMNWKIARSHNQGSIYFFASDSEQTQDCIPKNGYTYKRTGKSFLCVIYSTFKYSKELVGYRICVIFHYLTYYQKSTWFIAVYQFQISSNEIYVYIQQYTFPENNIYSSLGPIKN